MPSSFSVSTICITSASGSLATAVSNESSYTWEGVSPAACDEILWGLLTLHRAMQDNEELESVNVSLKVMAGLENFVRFGTPAGHRSFSFSAVHRSTSSAAALTGPEMDT